MLQSAMRTARRPTRSWLRLGLRPGMRPGMRLGLRLGMRLGLRLGMRLALRLGMRPGMRLGLRLGMRLALRLGMRLRMPKPRSCASCWESREEESMTVLGINMTDKDRTYGWADITPSRKPMPKAVADAWESWQAAMADYNRLTDMEFCPPELSAAYKIEREAEAEYRRLRHLWQDHYWDEILPDELQAAADESEAEGIFNWLGGDQ